MAVATSRPNGGLPRLVSQSQRARRILAAPRVGFLLRSLLALAAIGASVRIAAFLGMGSLAGQILGVLLPLGLVTALGSLLARRALSVSLPGATGALAALPLAVVLIQQGMGRPVSLAAAADAVWYVLGAGVSILAIVPSRRLPASVFASWAPVVVASLVAVAAALAVAEVVPEIASRMPFFAGGVSIVFCAWAVLVSIVLGLHAGLGEPLEERVHPHLADADQIWGSVAVVAVACVAATYAWIVPGKSISVVSATPGIVVPTAMLYALPILGLYWAVFGRLTSTRVFWGTVLALAGGAYFLWYSDRSATADAVARHYAAVSGNPRRDASPEIASVVFAMGRQTIATEAMSGLGGLRIFEVVDGQSYEIMGQGGRARVPALPDRYFRVSPIAFPAGVPGSRATMVEQVDYGRATPIAVDVEGRVSEPLLPPMIGRDGWLSVERTIHPVDSGAPRMTSADLKASAFVSAVLRGKTFVRNPLD